MRSDMSKVIVERPRAYRGHRGRSSPRMPNRTRICALERGNVEAMGRGYAEKSLNENLAPLLRWMHAQVGRRWNEVFSELSKHIRMRSTVQKHVLDHVRQMVAEYTQLNEHGVHCSTWGGLAPLRGWSKRGALYVERGILRCAPFADLGTLRFRKVSDTVFLMRSLGIWYRLTLAESPATETHPQRIDAYTGEQLGSRAHSQRMWQQPPPWASRRWDARRTYATTKQQLTKSELRYYMSVRGASQEVKP
jgi:hypothetical protein